MMDEKFTLHLGDSLEIMRGMTDNSVDSIVTDPPYELGFMGKGWDKSGIANSVEMWREALRVLKPGAHLLAFSGSRTYHRMTCAIEDAGFEVRDQIMWIYGSGFPKGHNLNGEWKGWGTALKPAHEPICVARKPFNGTVAANVLEHGTGALNIDECRVGDTGARNNGRSAGTNGIYGHIGSTTKIDYEKGRFPSNMIHDGSDEVVSLFPSKAGAAAPVKGTEQSQASVGIITGSRDRVPGAFHGDTGSAARFFYCAKANKKDRNEGCEHINAKQYSHDGRETPIDNAYQRNSSSSNIHPTVKPTDLMAYLCRLVTPPGGTVLDPFMGSGSTGKAAMREGFRFIGIDITPEYVEIARARIEHERTKENKAPIQPSLFEAVS